MNNKIIRLEDFQNKSLDSIIELFANGYRLGTESAPVQYLQTTPMLGFTIWTVLIAGIVAGATIMILSSKKKS